MQTWGYNSNTGTIVCYSKADIQKILNGKIVSSLNQSDGWMDESGL